VSKASSATPSTLAIALSVLVAALGNFVDTYDLMLFSVVRIASLKDLGLSGQDLTDKGLLVLNLQMFGMLVGGIAWGVLGDRRGRMSVLFGSIVLYSLANIANAYVQSVEAYAALRFVAGIGLAGELGAGITLVTEIMPKAKRGYGTMVVAAVGLLGAVTAVLVARQVDWRQCYLIGGVAGLMLLVLRVGVSESPLFARSVRADVSRGNILMLFRSKAIFLRYLACLLVGLPIWYVIGILVTFSPEFGRALGVRGELVAGTAVLLSYAGGAIGDVLASLLAQVTRRRKVALVTFILFYAAGAIVYHNMRDLPAARFNLIFLVLGIGSGFWVTLITVGAEQFGTNIRATVATTVPNFVRAMAIPITGSFALLKPQIGFLNASAVVGVVCFGLSLMAASRLRETFDADLDYVERDGVPT
jgi:putative MFS transporter